VESYSLAQHGPTTFYLRAILQRLDNSWSTSNKMMYEATHSQSLKLKRENRWVQWVCHWNRYTMSIKICYKSLSVRCLWLRLTGHYRLFNNTSILEVASQGLMVWFFICHSISFFRFDLLHRRKCAPIHLCASKHQANFNVKSFCLENLSLVTTRCSLQA